MHMRILAALAALVLVSCGGGGGGGSTSGAGPATPTQPPATCPPGQTGTPPNCVTPPPLDTDGDSVPDSSDAFPNDASESRDSDGDGVGDNADHAPHDPNVQTAPPPPPPVAQFVDEAARLVALSDTVIQAEAGPCAGGGQCLAFVLGGLFETNPVPAGLTLEEIDIDDISYESVASRGAVSLAKGQHTTTLGTTTIRFDAIGYGGWLDHSFFHAHLGITTVRDITVTRSWWPDAYSLGAVTGSNPTAIAGSAAWAGAMVGMDISDSARLGHAISGDAEIRIPDLLRPRVSIAFTNIRDEDAGTARGDMVWNNLAVRDGTFEGSRIRGQFYGPNHEEVGGVFSRNDIHGAFGAARQ